MKRFTVAFVTLSGCVLGTACQAIVGIEDRVEAPALADDAGELDVAPSPATDAADGGGTDANEGGCPEPCVDPDAGQVDCPTGCLPPAPLGWKGPSATYDGAELTKPTGCPAEYPDEELDAYQGVSAAPATCDCGTPVITGRKCSFDLLTYSDVGCTVGGNLVATLSGCSNVANLPTNYKLSTGVFSAGTCTYPNAAPNKPAPSFTKVDVACGRAQAPACTGRADCVEAPFPDGGAYGRLCIHKDGEQPCPLKDYPARFVAYKTVNDARSCTACTGTPSGGTCGTSWLMRGSELQCPTLAPGDKSINTCYNYAGGGKVIDTVPAQPSAGSCTTTPGTPTGNTSLVDPVTFCCTF